VPDISPITSWDDLDIVRTPRAVVVRASPALGAKRTRLALRCQAGRWLTDACVRQEPAQGNPARAPAHETLGTNRRWRLKRSLWVNREGVIDPLLSEGTC